MAGSDHSDLACPDHPSRRLDSGYCTIRVPADARDLTILNDIDSQSVGGAGIAPGHNIVARNATATLQGRPEDRVAQRGRDVERWAKRPCLRWRQPVVVYAVKSIRMHMPLGGAHITNSMHCARGWHAGRPVNASVGAYALWI
jgi:hypothetical protein